MYDEDDAIAFIRQAIGADVSALYTDDDLLNVIDMIFDYYESNGMLDPDFVDEAEENADELLDDIAQYAKRMLRKDREAHMDHAHLRPIIAAEIDYEQSII